MKWDIQEEDGVERCKKYNIMTNIAKILIWFL